MNHFLHKWLRIALINLSVIALIGVILRYKIVFSLPIIDQKHLLHAHSHFAFAGWLTQVLMTLMVAFLYQKGLTNAFKKYGWLLLFNLITAYGMLITFSLEGYGVFSISFSTLSVVVSYFFAVIFWKDLNSLKSSSVSHFWFKAAIIFNAVSSIGAFSLAFMMAKHIIHQNWYLSAVYFFLHFQYNGWFFFVCAGLLIDKLESHNIFSNTYKTIFWIFFLAFTPAYFLSTLWMRLSVWIYIIVVISALAQVVGWILLVRIMYLHLETLNKVTSIAGRCLLSLAAFAVSIKFFLQLGSTYPALSTMAFGFRPIVIGYLHLVLLGALTMFVLGYIVANGFISLKLFSIIGICVFVFGIIVNEIILMAQGVSDLQYDSIPYANEMLLITEIIMFTGMLLFVIDQFKNRITIIPVR